MVSALQKVEKKRDQVKKQVKLLKGAYFVYVV